MSSCCMAYSAAAPTGRYADLGVDVLDVAADGLHADRQLTCDVLRGAPAHDETEHLDLAVGEAVGPGATRPVGMTRGSEHGVDRLSISRRALRARRAQADSRHAARSVPILENFGVR